ncbi:GNAT family N-acetyltransferase [Curtobacterium sp. RRHDQ10]|uniref:GNAT family N-acetyltransferase n=1 Tax=Curtobacterium phyllosphaerae TaxID=3413379 RepID=UPI003BF38153
MTLSSPFVRLDMPTRADTVAITDACQDASIQRFTTIPVPYRPQDAHAFVDALVGPGWASDRECTWAIRRPGSTWLDGVVSYRTSGRELGFWLAPSARGLGLMSAAVGLVVDWAFGRGDPDVYWECFLGNTASAGVARRAGFSYTGVRPGRLPGRDGSPVDCWTGLLRADGRRASDIAWPTESVSS